MYARLKTSEYAMCNRVLNVFTFHTGLGICIEKNVSIKVSTSYYRYLNRIGSEESITQNIDKTNNRYHKTNLPTLKLILQKIPFCYS